MDIGNVIKVLNMQILNFKYVWNGRTVYVATFELNVVRECVVLCCVSTSQRRNSKFLTATASLTTHRVSCDLIIFCTIFQGQAMHLPYGSCHFSPCQMAGNQTRCARGSQSVCVRACVNVCLRVLLQFELILIIYYYLHRPPQLIFNIKKKCLHLLSTVPMRQDGREIQQTH